MAMPTEKPLLHHFPTSGSSQKLHWALAENGVQWEDRLVNLLRGEQHNESYRTLNPKGVVPTLVWGKYTLTEVGPTLELLEDWIPIPTMRPDDALECHQMRCWVKRVDEVVHPANGMLTYTIAGRDALLALPTQQLEAMFQAMPNDHARRLRPIAVREGVKAAEFAEAVRTHDQLLVDVDKAVSRYRYLVGDSFSLADITVGPYIKRLEHL